MRRIKTLCLLLTMAVVATATPMKPRPEIMGIALGMSRAEARVRLQSLGTLEREARKQQEVWAVKDQRISHLLVGYDPDFRVRYVTALARTGGPRIRYEEVADLKHAQRSNNQGNYKFTWEVEARGGKYLLIAHGHNPEYLDSYSVKNLDGKEVD